MTKAVHLNLIPDAGFREGMEILGFSLCGTKGSSVHVAVKL
jgi:hypothetical protein